MSTTVAVNVTAEDVRFVRLAVEHYGLFAEVSEKQGQTRTAGMFRAQEFHAERFLARLEEAGDSP